MHTDDPSWAAAGGDLARLRLYRTIGDVAVFADGADRCMAGIHPDLPEIGAVGDWVGGDAVREAAEAWLASRGVTTLRAPMELCTWFPYRVNTGPYDEPPFLFEVTERPQRWKAAGYTVATTYASVLLPHDGMIRAAMDRAASLSSRGWTIHPLPAGEDGRVPEGAFLEAVDMVHQIATEAFADAYGYAPIPAAALRAWYAPYREQIDPRLVFFARAPSGDVAGFVFGVPDHLAPERGWFLVKTAATRPRYHGTGVGTWLAGRAHQEARKLGYKAGLYALMWEGAPSNHWTRHGGTVVRRYALLEKPAR